MKEQDVMSEYRRMEQREKAVEKIDRVIEEREGKGFCLSADFDPAISSEEEASMSNGCEALHRELVTRGFDVFLDEGVPLKVVYLYMQHVALIAEGLRLPEGERIVFNGCGGWCEGCFQSPWCSIKEEMDREEAEEMAAKNA